MEINVIERQSDILKIVEQLDISPTMYRNAVEKYGNIARYIQEHQDLEIDIYPQGSFAIGTVIRPVINREKAEYDLDFVCHVRCTRGEMTANELRRTIEEVLSSSDLYGGKMEIFDECIKINYADIGGVSFSIDVVPAINESEEKKEQLRSKCEYPQLIDEAIAIPKYKDATYVWLTNNPKGYQAWFENINRPFREVSSNVYRKNLFEQNQDIFASVEEIPKEMERSALQRVIQILKCHRDVYYSHLANGKKIKPISAIISTTVAQIADSTLPYRDTFELLRYVLNEFAIYSERQSIRGTDFLAKYSGRDVFGKTDGKWEVKNPANPEDNLADQWNENPEIPSKFFVWLRAAKSNLIDGLEKDNEEFRAITETAFDPELVEDTWKGKYKEDAKNPVEITNMPKPWREK